jgi:hypothetical protein
MAGFARVAALLGFGLLAACSAPQVTPDKIAAVTPGQTTYDQVVDMFGLPSSELRLDGGSRVSLYQHDEFDRSGEQLVPFYNLFQAKYDTIVYDYFIFNREGVLQSFSVPQAAAIAKVANPGS